MPCHDDRGSLLPWNDGSMPIFRVTQPNTNGFRRNNGLARARLVGYRHHRYAVFNQGNIDIEVGRSRNESRGPINWIDNPAAGEAETRRIDRVFFSQNRVSWKGRAQSLANQLRRCQVGVGYDRTIGFDLLSQVRS